MDRDYDDHYNTYSKDAAVTNPFCFSEKQMSLNVQKATNIPETEDRLTF